MIKEAILNFKRIRKHRKEVGKICEERFMALYNNPFYNDELEIIKEELKRDINIYKRIQIMHDLSCYRPKEFIPSMYYFYGKYGVQAIGKINEGDKGYEKHKKIIEKYLESCIYHKKYNKHHCDYFYIMQREDIIEMIVDWEAEYGNSQKYYLENYKNIVLQEESRIILEEELGLRKFRGIFKYSIYDMDLSKIKSIYPEKQFNVLLSYVNKRYNLDLYSMLP